MSFSILVNTRMYALLGVQSLKTIREITQEIKKNKHTCKYNVKLL